ncbi:MAG: hypothetical protein Kapaf2KO_17660 [Candidatus Kapaibacteriales bacterium]
MAFKFISDYLNFFICMRFVPNKKAVYAHPYVVAIKYGLHIEFGGVKKQDAQS